MLSYNFATKITVQKPDLHFVLYKLLRFSYSLQFLSFIFQDCVPNQGFFLLFTINFWFCVKRIHVTWIHWDSLSLDNQNFLYCYYFIVYPNFPYTNIHYILFSLNILFCYLFFPSKNVIFLGERCLVLFSYPTWHLSTLLEYTVESQ